MRISGSLWRKGVLTIAAAAGFIWLYQTSVPDSRFSMLPLGFVGPEDPTAPPQPGARAAFSATAYCKGQVTASGVAVQAGSVAADPKVLPAGSVIEVDAQDPVYDGMYTVLDTGPEIKGREVDLYMWSCFEALEFGRQPVHVTVLRLGWNPHATTPSFVDRVFRRPVPAAASAQPPPVTAAPAAPAPVPDPMPTPTPELEPLPSRPLPAISSETEK